MSLGRKQSISNEAWLEAVATIESAVPRRELDDLVAVTIEDIRATVGQKKAAYAWSAGKDSVVLGKLCEAAGVTDSMIGVCDLEYPAFMAWVNEHKPARASSSTPRTRKTSPSSTASYSSAWTAWPVPGTTGKCTKGW